MPFFLGFKGLLLFFWFYLFYIIMIRFGSRRNFVLSVSVDGVVLEMKLKKENKQLLTEEPQV